MSKATQKFFEQLAQNNAQRIGPEVAKEAKEVLAHGAHELAAALFTGSGFVMYARDSSAVEQGKEIEGQPTHGLGTPEKEQGMER